MNSCIYEGPVRHRRFSPAAHAFRYRLFMLYLDLDELDTVFCCNWFWSVDRPNLAWFKRSDHTGDPAVPLAQTIRDLVEHTIGKRPEGPIRLLTHLRYFGYCFNPVSFYYCFDQAGRAVETIVAEVHNTPWNERHCYVLGNDRNEAQGPQKRFRFDKAFHVSPFMDMDVRYDWRFTDPSQRLTIRMENRNGAGPFFDAAMTLSRRKLTGRSLALVLLRYPFMTGQVIGGIYWHAFRLWLKRCPLYTHPRKEAGNHPTV